MILVSAMSVRGGQSLTQERSDGWQRNKQACSLHSYPWNNTTQRHSLIQKAARAAAEGTAPCVAQTRRKSGHNRVTGGRVRTPVCVATVAPSALKQEGTVHILTICWEYYAIFFFLHNANWRDSAVI